MDTFNKTSQFKITTSKKKLKGNAGNNSYRQLEQFSFNIEMGKASLTEQSQERIKSTAKPKMKVFARQVIEKYSQSRNKAALQNY